MFIEGDQLQLLTDIGFTKTQAKIYLALLKLEEANGRMLSDKTKVARPEVYRTLGELQKKGLVEKEIGTPYMFKAVPVDLGLQILIQQRIRQCNEIQARANEFIQQLRNVKKETLPKQEYKLIKIEGRERLKQILKPQHDRAHRTIDILTTLPRWLQILQFCFENYEEALARGVKYRVLLEAFSSEIGAHENIDTLLKTKNFELRLSKGALKTNAAIFDEKEVAINFFPSLSLSESPIIWTNHPSFISMCQDHFNTIWKTARKYKPAN